MQTRIPDFYVPSVYSEALALANATGLSSTAWPSANLAIYVPVIFPYSCILNGMNFGTNTASGNYDIGLYDGYTKKKIASSGSVAISSTGIKTFTFSSPVKVDAGRLYYAALAKSSTGTAIRAPSELNACIAVGLGQQASALPLPDPMVPATVANAFLPLITFNVR